MKKIHFMGIGGSGINAAAGIAAAFGYEVSGCDLKESEYTADLLSKNVSISYGHSAEHLFDCDLLCVTPAVFDLNNKHEEMIYAHDNGIPVMTWQQFLGEELQKNKRVIAISGTKGKTTTTALTGFLLENAGFDPTVAVGGLVKDWERNYRVGEGSFFVCEADEFNKNFRYYSPEIGVITNIEMDHPEYFQSFEEYLTAFSEFAGTIHPGGYLVLGTDSPGVVGFISSGKLPKQVQVIGVGLAVPDSEIIKQLAAFVTVRTSYDGRVWRVGYSVTSSLSSIDFPSLLSDFELAPSISGEHNARNVAVVEVLCNLTGALPLRKQDAYARFSGVGRRFELICDKNDIKVFNDYAHNPMSIQAVLKTSRQMFQDSRIWAVFQPHMYSRTKLLLDEFALSFMDADNVIITDIFASREQNKQVSHEVHSTDLVERVKALNPSIRVEYIADFDAVVDSLVEQLAPGDVVVNIGAGNNGIIVEKLCQKIQ